MTMGFKLPPGKAPSDLKVGDAVGFEVREAQGGYEIVTITKSGAAGAKK